MKLIKITLIFAILLCFGFAASPPMQRFISVAKMMETKFAPEKAYVHTDKPFYTTGETIWLKGYLVNGITHKKTNKSNVLYVELINPSDSIVVKRKLYVDDNTFGVAGDIEISKEWESGKYQLRAYTRYMQNEDSKYFFRKLIKIEQQREFKKEDAFTEMEKAPEFEDMNFANSILDIEKISDQLNLKFYAEGGTVVDGFPNKFGIKATYENNEGAIVQGAIKEKGKDAIIVMFRTFDFGLGTVAFIPQKNKQYIAEIETKNGTKTFELPKVDLNSQKLGVTKKDNTIILQVSSNERKLSDFFIIGHLRGKVCYSKIISDNEKEFATKLVTDSLTSGVIHFTLFEPSGKPVSERLVFVDNTDKSTKSSISLSKKTIAKRERQNININIQSNQKKVNANISLAVTQKNTVPLSINENIKSWLLLNSDLRGKVSNAALFFDSKKTKKQREYLMESLLLTHGWRRFSWNNYVQKAYKYSQKITPEEGILIKGRTTPPKEEYEKLFALTKINFLGGDFYTEKKFTDKDGKFSYGPFVIHDSVITTIQAELPNRDEIEKDKVAIYLDEDPESPSIDSLPPYQNDIENLYFENYKKMQDYIGQLNFTFEGVNALNEVLIVAEKEPEVNSYDAIVEDLAIYGQPSHRLIIDSIPGTSGLSVLDLVGRLPGVQLVGGYPDQRVIIRGQSSFQASSDPLFVIDGVEVGPEFIQGIQASEVSFIDVLKGNDAAIYGSRAANGVVAIYLVQPGNADYKDDTLNVVTFTTSPFYKAQEFFAPDYFKASIDPKPDYRTTLHWNPNLNLTTNKVLNEYFYTGDQTGVFQIEIEGITEDGELIYATEEFEVVQAL